MCSRIHTLTTVADRIAPMVELIQCSHRRVYTNQTVHMLGSNRNREERTDDSEAKPGESMITVTAGSKRPGTTLYQCGDPERFVADPDPTF